MTDQIRKTIDTLLDTRRANIKRAGIDKTEFERHKEEVRVLENSLQILQEAARQVQQSVHGRVSSIVTRSLAAIFDDPYEFVIQFESKRGKTEAVPKFLRNETEVDPLSASGGGVVDVAAFSLRLANLVLRRPPLRRILFLDEPFRFVSSEYLPRIRGLLESLAEEFDVQIIMVTHIDQLRCGEVVEVV